MLTFKVKAFPGADVIWSKIVGEGEDEKEVKVDPKDKAFARLVIRS
jgi:hypothetical protein